MGHAYVHPQYLKTPQDIVSVVSHSALELHQENVDPEKEDALIKGPIIIPSIMIKQSPFKNIGFRTKETSDKCSTDVDYQHQGQHMGQSRQEENIVVRQSLWNSVVHDTKIFGVVADMLEPKDRLSLSMVSSRINTQIYLYCLFHRPNNWDLTFHIIENKILKSSRFSFHKMLNQSLHQQSQHSLDLDRLETLFLPHQDPTQQTNRLDKVMRAIHSRGIPYFQGLNSILVVLLSLFNEEVSYWIACQLIQQTKNIHDRPQFYLEVLQKIQKELKIKCPLVYQHLEKLELGLSYFAMKWVMGLFSTDLSRNLVLSFWDLLINFGLNSLIWFVVSIFMSLQSQILCINDSDELNVLLKTSIKQLLKDKKGNFILQKTRIMMSEEQYGEGCSQIIQPWNAYDEQWINVWLKQFPQSFQGVKIQIQTINEQQVQHDLCDVQEEYFMDEITDHQTDGCQRQLQHSEQGGVKIGEENRENVISNVEVEKKELIQQIIRSQSLQERMEQIGDGKQEGCDKLEIREEVRVEDQMRSEGVEEMGLPRGRLKGKQQDIQDIQYRSTII